MQNCLQQRVSLCEVPVMWKGTQLRERCKLLATCGEQAMLSSVCPGVLEERTSSGKGRERGTRRRRIIPEAPPWIDAEAKDEKRRQEIAKDEERKKRKQSFEEHYERFRYKGKDEVKPEVKKIPKRARGEREGRGGRERRRERRRRRGTQSTHRAEVQIPIESA